MTGGKTAATVRRDAVDVLRARGWTQGWFVDDEDRCCMAEAIYRANHDGHRITEQVALRTVKAVVGAGDRGVSVWNDEPGRTQAEVEAALLAAAARLDAGSGEPQ